MKIKGRSFDGPKEGILVLPRDDGDIVFKFRAITDDAPFLALSPHPVPPKVQRTGVGIIDNVEDPSYKKACEEWFTRKMDWMFLTSISATEDLEWNTVKLDDPVTWRNWRTEIQTSGFSIGEGGAIYGKFIETTMVTDEMLKQARDRFLAGVGAIQSPQR